MNGVLETSAGLTTRQEVNSHSVVDMYGRSQDAYFLPMWKELETNVPIDLRATLFCGQVFHFELLSNGLFIGNVHGHPAILAQHGDRVYFFETCRGIEHALWRFFNLDVTLPDSFDHRGVRFITNDIHSAIFSFICSANNNVKRITKMVHFIYSLGEPIDIAAMYSASPDASHPSFLPDISRDLGAFKIYSFPALDRIAHSEATFREAKFGYRSGYVVAAAQFLLEAKGNWSDLTFEDARSRLLEIKGVGKKVADCVCLTSLKFFHVVPLDVHIIRYSLREFKLAYEKVASRGYSEIQRLWVERYGEFAGIQQLYVFKRSLDVSKAQRPVT